jgi:hypothetical protein
MPISGLRFDPGTYQIRTCDTAEAWTQDRGYDDVLAGPAYRTPPGLW